MPNHPTKARRRAAPVRPRPGNVDRHVAARIRERRTMLGLTQQDLAELIGVTYQQAHKYERGMNRITVGRLHAIARALGVEVGYFFEGAESGNTAKLTPQRRLMLRLARDFVAIPSRRHQEALCQLARDIAGLRWEKAEPGEGSDPGAAGRAA